MSSFNRYQFNILARQSDLDWRFFYNKKALQDRASRDGLVTE